MEIRPFYVFHEKGGGKKEGERETEIVYKRLAKKQSHQGTLLGCGEPSSQSGKTVILILPSQRELSYPWAVKYSGVGLYLSPCPGYPF